MKKPCYAALLVAAAVVGCGGPEAPVTDATKVPPLTAEQLERIKSDDQRVEEEEGGAFLKLKAKHGAKVKRRG